MRWLYGAIPENHNFNPEEQGWAPLKEPNPRKMQFVGIFLGIAIAVLLYYILPLDYWSIRVKWHTVVILFAMIPVHELIHAFTHPRFGMSNDTHIGVWPSKFSILVYFKGERSRTNFLLSLAMPFLVLTVIPLVMIYTVLQDASPLIITDLSLLILANGIGAAGDIIGIFILLTQVPSNAKLKNKGWRTHWKI